MGQNSMIAPQKSPLIEQKSLVLEQNSPLCLYAKMLNDAGCALLRLCMRHVIAKEPYDRAKEPFDRAKELSTGAKQPSMPLHKVCKKTLGERCCAFVCGMSLQKSPMIGPKSPMIK